MSMMRGGSMGLMRRLGQDPDLADHRLTKGVLRRILRFARPYRTLILVFVGLVVLTSALAVTPPLLFKEIIDQGVLQGNRRLLVVLGSAVAVVAVLQAVLGLVQRWFSSTIGEGLIYDLRTQVFDHVAQMPVAFFTRTQTGKLVSRLNSDVIGAQQAFTSTLSTVLSNLISLILVLTAMLILSWQLTLAALVMLPIFLIPAKVVGRKLAELTRRQMQLNGDMSAMMTERFSISGALLVKLFGRLTDEHDRFANRAGAVRDVSVKIAMNGRFFMTSLGLVAALATALVYGVGGSLAIDGVLTVGTLTALAGLLGQLYGPLTQLTNLRIDVMNALVSFDRVFEVLDLPPMIRDADDAVPVDGPASVTFEHVGFTYPSAAEVSLASLESIASLDQRPNTEVLHDVSFAVAPGQTVALVGRSGGGKTTMTHLVARLFGATSGTVSVAGLASGPARSPPARRGATSPRTRTCSTTRSGTTCATPGLRPTTRACGRCSKPPRSLIWCGAFPTAWTRWWVNAATGCRGASGNGWRSPDCCSRRRPSWCSTRPPPTWTPNPRLPSSGRWTWRWRTAPAS